MRLLLNSGFTGANAFFALAQQRDWLAAAGLDIAFTPGNGAYTAAGRLVAEDFDFAYGDLNALIEMAALNPSADLPCAVFVAHQRAPSCITVPRGSSVVTPRDLAGCRIVGHASDVALRTFAAYAGSAGLDATRVQIDTSDAAMAGLLQGVLAGTADAAFGYLTTHTAALASVGLRADEAVRFFPYRDVCGALYGSALMASPRAMHDHPDAVARLVAVMRDGIVAAQARPDAAIDAVMALNPQGQRQIERARWDGTLLGDIAWPSDAGPAGAWPGLGDVSDDRLSAAITCLAHGFGWAHVPRAERIFTRRFLVGGA